VRKLEEDVRELAESVERAAHVSSSALKAASRMEAAHVELSTDVSTTLHDLSTRMNQMITSHSIKVHPLINTKRCCVAALQNVACCGQALPDADRFASVPLQHRIVCLLDADGNT
jgi:hypothetical protein